MSKEQYDTLDLLITAYKEQEKELSDAIERIEAVACRLEELIADK